MTLRKLFEWAEQNDAMDKEILLEDDGKRYEPKFEWEVDHLKHGRLTIIVSKDEEMDDCK